MGLFRQRRRKTKTKKTKKTTEDFVPSLSPEDVAIDFDSLPEVTVDTRSPEELDIPEVIVDSTVTEESVVLEKRLEKPVVIEEPVIEPVIPTPPVIEAEEEINTRDLELMFTETPKVEEPVIVKAKTPEPELKKQELDIQFHKNYVLKIPREELLEKSNNIKFYSVTDKIGYELHLSYFKAIEKIELSFYFYNKEGKGRRLYQKAQITDREKLIIKMSSNKRMLKLDIGNIYKIVLNKDINVISKLTWTYDDLVIV